MNEPYHIAYETVSKTTNIFIRIETSSGINGFGCAAPDEPVTGEKADLLPGAVDSVIIPALKGSDPLRRTPVDAKIENPPETYAVTSGCCEYGAAGYPGEELRAASLEDSGWFSGSHEDQRHHRDSSRKGDPRKGPFIGKGRAFVL